MLAILDIMTQDLKQFGHVKQCHDLETSTLTILIIKPALERTVIKGVVVGRRGRGLPAGR